MQIWAIYLHSEGRRHIRVTTNSPPPSLFRSLGLRDGVRDAVHEPRAHSGTPVCLRDGVHVLPERRDLPHVRHPGTLSVPS